MKYLVCLLVIITISCASDSNFKSQEIYKPLERSSTEKQIFSFTPNEIEEYFCHGELKKYYEKHKHQNDTT